MEPDESRNGSISTGFTNGNWKNGHLVIDIETKKEVSEVKGGWASKELLRVSCAVTFDMGSKSYQLYDDTKADLFDLKSEILMTRRVTTYNGWQFDYPVIWARAPHWKNMGINLPSLMSSCDDILMRIWLAAGLNPYRFDKKTHSGYGLEAGCQSTLGEGKSGHGADAPIMYKSRRWGKLISYCMDDVRLTAELSSFIDKNGYCVASGRKITVPTWKEDTIK